MTGRDAPTTDSDGTRPRVGIYGGADTVVCLAHGRLSDVPDFVRS